MALIEFEDNTDEIIGVMREKALAWLEEAGGEIEAQTKTNSRRQRGGGGTAGSFEHKVDEGTMTCSIGSPEENAIWEEFGTGEYALNGDGRAGAWYVPVDSYTGEKRPTYNGQVVIVYGKNGKKFYKTNGKRGTRALFNAFNSMKVRIVNGAKARFEDLGG